MIPRADTPQEVARRLHRDILAFQARYQAGELGFLDWLKARQLCVKEASFLECEGELLALLRGES